MQPRIFARYLGTLAVLLAMFAIAPPIVASPQEDNKEVSKLLEDVKIQAAALNRDSDELESFARSNVSWQSHGAELEMIKDRVNAIALARVEDFRHDSDLFGEGARSPDGQLRFQAAFKHGCQPREAELDLAQMLSDLG